MSGDKPRPAVPRAPAIRQGEIVRAAHNALHAAGEAAPEFEFLAQSVGRDGTMYVLLSSHPKGPRVATNLRPGEKLYAMLDNDAGVYECTPSQNGTLQHRAIRHDGTVKLLTRSPFQ